MLGVVSGLFQVVPGCSGSVQPVLVYYGMFQFALFLQTMTLQNVSICKFIRNKLHLRFYYKVEQALLKKGAALMDYTVGQVLLQSEAAFLC